MIYFNEFGLILNSLFSDLAFIILDIVFFVCYNTLISINSFVIRR